jgi:hypothetical protein
VQGENRNYLQLVESINDGCGVQEDNYLLSSSNNLKLVPRIPKDLLRNNFDYRPTWVNDPVDFQKIYHHAQSCNDPNLSYYLIMERTDNGFMPTSWYPDPEHCTSAVCKSPAARITLSNGNDKVDPNNDPTVFINDEETYTEILFPQETQGYLVTGIRDDIYQLYSNKFTAINIPIKNGMIHRYDLDLKAKENGEKNWIKIRIDSDGNGVYEDTQILGGNMITGPDFVKQCGSVCAGMEKF